MFHKNNLLIKYVRMYQSMEKFHNLDQKKNPIYTAVTSIV